MATTAAAQREIIRFEAGRTETVCLKYSTGKEVNGAGGPQFMFTTVDNRIFFIDPDVAYNIEKCGVAAGQPISITKSKGPRNTVNWDVRPAGASPSSAPAALHVGTTTATSTAATSLEQTLAASIAHVEARKAAAAAQDAPAQITPAQAKLMAALAVAIDSAVEASQYAARKGMPLTFTGEDIRCMANMIVINAERGR